MAYPPDQPWKDTKLSPKMRAWLKAYMGQAAGNATEAARLAGYKQPSTMGSRLRTRFLESGHLRPDAPSNPDIADPDEVRRFWTKAMRGNVTEQPSLGNEEGVPKLRDRLKASELLAKAARMFVEEVHHTGALDARVVLTTPDNGLGPPGYGEQSDDGDERGGA